MTNWDAVADATGEDDSDNWPGPQLELYPTTTRCEGKTVDCIRIRPPAQRELPKEKPAAPKPPEEGDAARKPSLAERNGRRNTAAIFEDETPHAPHCPGAGQTAAWHVFPCRPRDKRPATAERPQGCHHRSGTIQAVVAAASRDCNVAIATGAISGIFVVDDRRSRCRSRAAPARGRAWRVAGHRRSHHRARPARLLQDAGRAGAQFRRQDRPRHRRARRRRLRPGAADPASRAAGAIAGPSTAPTLRRGARTGCWPRSQSRTNGNAALPPPPAEWRDVVRLASAKANATTPSPGSRAICCATMSTPSSRSSLLHRVERGPLQPPLRCRRSRAASWIRSPARN